MHNESRNLTIIVTHLPVLMQVIVPWLKFTRLIGSETTMATHKIGAK